MSIKDIITVPDETLKKISQPLEKVSTNEKKLIHDLFDTMYASKGIGLAAVQIGILKRILVIDVSTKDEKREPLSFSSKALPILSLMNASFRSFINCIFLFVSDSNNTL